MSIAVAAALALAGAASVHAQDKRPSGTVFVNSISVGAGVGVTWGDGRLTYRGKEYTFSVKGLGLMDLGIVRAGVRGEVYDLKSIEDFSGTYLAGTAGVAVGSGSGAATMVNGAGVTIRLTGVGKGVRLVVGAEGVAITLKR